MTNLSDSFAALVRKYDQPGPRYTSYPTVPYWDDSPPTDEWLAHVQAELSRTNAPAALYIHLPFCRSLCTFCACNKIITQDQHKASTYVGWVLQEWNLYLRLLERERLRVGELHLGGGTPTFLTPEQLRLLLEPLMTRIDWASDAELSFEADPRVTTDAHLETLFDLGFRRLSLGIQDYDPEIQELIHRHQTVESVDRLTAKARSLGYTSVNFDLVYGLPRQRRSSIDLTMEQVLRQRPDRIAFYGYAHVPWVGKTGQRKFSESDVPTGEAKRVLYERGRELLTAAGYLEIGMDHFALPDDDLSQSMASGELFRNFMGYTPRHVSPMIGLGVTSISDAWSCFAQNEKEIDRYYERLSAGELPIFRGHRLTPQDLVLRRHILNLMTRFETSWQDAHTYLPELEDLPQRLAEPTADGLVEWLDRGLRVSPRGRPFIRNICMAFDARLRGHQPQKPIFSKTI